MMNDIEKAIGILDRKAFAVSARLCEHIPSEAIRNELSNDYDAFIMGQLALEKQIPKKPAWNCDNEIIHCPHCDYDLMGGIEIDSENNPEYCWECGQKLDWNK